MLLAVAGTKDVRVALKSQYLFVVGGKPFLAKQNIKYVCFHCTFQIFDIPSR